MMSPQNYNIPSEASPGTPDLDALLAVYPLGEQNLRPLAFAIATILRQIPDNTITDAMLSEAVRNTLNRVGITVSTDLPDDPYNDQVVLLSQAVATLEGAVDRDGTTAKTTARALDAFRYNGAAFQYVGYLGGYALATAEASGLMSAAQFNKLARAVPSFDALPDASAYSDDQIILVNGQFYRKVSVSEENAFSGIMGKAQDRDVVFTGVRPRFGSDFALGRWTANPNNSIYSIVTNSETQHVTIAINRDRYRAFKGSNEASGDSLTLTVTSGDDSQALTVHIRYTSPTPAPTFTSDDGTVYLLFTGSVLADSLLRTIDNGEAFNLLVRDSHATSVFTHAANFPHWVVEPLAVEGRILPPFYTVGPTLPPNPSIGDSHLFDVAVTNIAGVVDTDGSTAKTSFQQFGFVEYDGTQWKYVGVLGADGVVNRLELDTDDTLIVRRSRGSQLLLNLSRLRHTDLVSLTQVENGNDLTISVGPNHATTYGDRDQYEFRSTYSTDGFVNTGPVRLRARYTEGGQIYNLDYKNVLDIHGLPLVAGVMQRGELIQVRFDTELDAWISNIYPVANADHPGLMSQYQFNKLSRAVPSFDTLPDADDYSADQIILVDTKFYRNVSTPTADAISGTIGRRQNNDRVTYGTHTGIGASGTLGQWISNPNHVVGWLTVNNTDEVSFAIRRDEYRSAKGSNEANLDTLTLDVTVGNTTQSVVVTIREERLRTVTDDDGTVYLVFTGTAIANFVLTTADVGSGYTLIIKRQGSNFITHAAAVKHWVIYPLNVDGVRRPQLTIGNTLPTDALIDDLRLFDAAVTDLVGAFETDGTTARTTATAWDLFEFDGTRWIFQENIGTPPLASAETAGLMSVPLFNKLFALEDTHYNLTKIDAISDIPTTNTTVGDQIRIETRITTSIPSNVKGLDGTTTETVLEVGRVYQWDGTNWLKIGDGDTTDTHYTLTKVAAVGDIPASPAVGDVIRVTTAITASIPTTVKGRDGSTTETALAVGNEYRFDGTNWLKIGDGDTITPGGGGASTVEYVELNALEHFVFSENAAPEANTRTIFGETRTGLSQQFAYSDTNNKLYRWSVPSGGGTMWLGDLGNLDTNEKRQAVNGSHFLVANTGTGRAEFQIGGIGSVFPSDSVIEPGGVVEILIFANQLNTNFADGKQFNLIVTPHDELEPRVHYLTTVPQASLGIPGDIAIRRLSSTSMQLYTRGETAWSSQLTITTGTSGGVNLTAGVGFPSNPATNAFRLLTADATGLTGVVDRDGSTAKTTAKALDLFQHNGTNWVYIGFLGDTKGLQAFAALPDAAGYDDGYVILVEGTFYERQSTTEANTIAGVAGTYISLRGVSPGLGMGRWTSNPNNVIGWVTYDSTGNALGISIKQSSYRAAKGSNEAHGDQLTFAITVGNTTQNVTLTYQAPEEYTETYLEFEVVGLASDFVLRNIASGTAFKMTIQRNNVDFITHAVNLGHWVIYPLQASRDIPAFGDITTFENLPDAADFRDKVVLVAGRFWRSAQTPAADAFAGVTGEETNTNGVIYRGVNHDGGFNDTIGHWTSNPNQVIGAFHVNTLNYVDLNLRTDQYNAVVGRDAQDGDTLTLAVTVNGVTTNVTVEYLADAETRDGVTYALFDGRIPATFPLLVAPAGTAFTLRILRNNVPLYTHESNLFHWVTYPLWIEQIFTASAVESVDVRVIRKMTQSAYDNLASKGNETFYAIVG